MFWMLKNIICPKILVKATIQQNRWIGFGALKFRIKNKRWAYNWLIIKNLLVGFTTINFQIIPKTLNKLPFNTYLW